MGQNAASKGRVFREVNASQRWMGRSWRYFGGRTGGRDKVHKSMDGPRIPVWKLKIERGIGK